MKPTIEAIEPNFAVFTLTAIGLKIYKLPPDMAQDRAQTLVDSHKPGFLDGNHIGNGYTRAELGTLSFQYAIDSGLNVDEALNDYERHDLVEEFWSTIFPDSVHTPRYDLYLPELTGDPEDVAKAEPIRRKQLAQLLTLKALAKEDADHRGLAFYYIDELINRPSATEWLSTSSVRYTPEWLCLALAALFEEAEIERKNRQKQKAKTQMENTN